MAADRTLTSKRQSCKLKWMRRNPGSLLQIAHFLCVKYLNFSSKRSVGSFCADAGPDDGMIHSMVTSN